jgi:hypothetical protein
MAGQQQSSIRGEGSGHSKVLLGQMMSHFGNHVEAAIADQTISGDHEADLNPNTTHYGQAHLYWLPTGLRLRLEVLSMFL